MKLAIYNPKFGKIYLSKNLDQIQPSGYNSDLETLLKNHHPYEYLSKPGYLDPRPSQAPSTVAMHHWMKSLTKEYQTLTVPPFPNQSFEDLFWDAQTQKIMGVGFGGWIVEEILKTYSDLELLNNAPTYLSHANFETLLENLATKPIMMTDRQDILELFLAALSSYYFSKERSDLNAKITLNIAEATFFNSHLLDGIVRSIMFARSNGVPASEALSFLKFYQTEFFNKLETFLKTNHDELLSLASQVNQTFQAISFDPNWTLNHELKELKTDNPTTLQGKYFLKGYIQTHPHRVLDFAADSYSPNLIMDLKYYSKEKPQAQFWRQLLAYAAYNYHFSDTSYWPFDKIDHPSSILSKESKQELATIMFERTQTGNTIDPVSGLDESGFYQSKLSELQKRDAKQTTKSRSR